MVIERGMQTKPKYSSTKFTSPERRISKAACPKDSVKSVFVRAALRYILFFLKWSRVLWILSQLPKKVGGWSLSVFKRTLMGLESFPFCLKINTDIFEWNIMTVLSFCLQTSLWGLSSALRQPVKIIALLYLKMMGSPWSFYIFISVPVDRDVHIIELEIVIDSNIGRYKYRYKWI